MEVLQDGLRWQRQGAPVHGLPASFQWFGQSQTVGQLIVFFSAIAVLGFFAFAMRLTPFPYRFRVL